MYKVTCEVTATVVIEVQSDSEASIVDVAIR